MEIVNVLKVLFIFSEKLHRKCLTGLQIRLCSSTLLSNLLQLEEGLSGNFPPGVTERNLGLPLLLNFFDLHQTQKQQDESWSHTRPYLRAKSNEQRAKSGKQQATSKKFSLHQNSVLNIFNNKKKLAIKKTELKISHIALEFPLLTLNNKIPARKWVKSKQDAAVVTS